MKKPLFLSLTDNKVLILLAVLYAVVAVFCVRNVIVRTQGSTDAIEQIFAEYSLKNEGTQAIDRVADEHPFLGGLFASPIKRELKLPSDAKSDEALGPGLRQSLKTVRQESSVAAWWSWFLLSVSLLYVVTIIALERSFTARSVLFALTTISVSFFIIGILAPGIIIWTAPSIPMASGNLEFIVQHQVRGIAAIIWDLLKADHWIIGGFLLLFSILTPLTKATLTFFVTACSSKELNLKIGQVLHTIGKWSMADVFVAAILLALYALKFQQATKSIPCLGLYYFTGYCLMSMTTTELLVNSAEAAGQGAQRARKKVSWRVIAALFAFFFCFTIGSSYYTYQQYTLNMKEKIKAPSSPEKLNNSDLVLPVHT